MHTMEDARTLTLARALKFGRSARSTLVETVCGRDIII